MTGLTRPLTAAATPSFCRLKALDNLRGAMLAQIGHAPNAIQTTGKLERFDTVKRGDKCGWYVAHLTQWGMVARFGDWREGYPYKWTSFEENTLSRADLAEFRRLQQQQDQERKAERDRLASAAREKAELNWSKAKPANHAHPYLIHKRVQAHGIRQMGDKLIIPITDLAGCLHNLQTITPDGTKRFLFGGRKRGLCFILGSKLFKQDTVYLCEGYATGASLYEAYQLPVLVAFDAGNLLPVAQAFRRRYRNILLTVCADNDRKGVVNTGLIKAREVVAHVPAAQIIVPEFPDNAPLELSDFNDAVNFYCMEARS